MTTTKHTPGPWRIGRDYGAVVADTPIQNGITGSNHVEAYGGHLIAESISDCNKPLIAAAPELLDALVELFRSYKQLADCGDSGHWSLEVQPEGQKAMAAITKATGEQPC